MEIKSNPCPSTNRGEKKKKKILKSILKFDLYMQFVPSLGFYSCRREDLNSLLFSPSVHVSR